MKKIRLFFTAIMVLMTAVLAEAQTSQVTGTVYDAENGEVIPFASVRVKDTMIGASVGADGTYSINVPSHGNPVLVFSFVGYKTTELPVEGRNLIDCHLEPDATTLEDVVVVAYGSAKREAVTGSVTSVKGETLASAPVVSVDKALSGKLAGVQVTQSTGQLGATSQIRIRGNSSINATNNPLWVIDGIPVLSGNVSDDYFSVGVNSGTLATLNPNDIESITVLKDAAAAAVYGSRAAAGVILVQTKSGREGKAQFDARAKYGLTWLQSDTGFRPMTAEELLTYQRDAIINAGMDPDDPSGKYYRPLSLLDEPLTNWVDHLTRLGNLQEYEVSARGGTSKAKYFSSLNFQKNKGIFYGTEYSKFSARINADYQLTPKLGTGVKVNAGYTDQSNASTDMSDGLAYANPLFSGFRILPWTPAYDENGDHNDNIPENSDVNPIKDAKYNDTLLKTYRFNGSMYLRWEPVKNLVLETKNSAEAIFTDQRLFFSTLAGYQSNNLDEIQQSIFQITTSNTANYANVFGGYHSFRALLGQEAMRYHGNYRFNRSQPTLEIPYPGSGDQSLSIVDTSISNETLLSFFGIVDYNYDNRYFVQATLRADGSSLFGSRSKWGMFWSGSASWNISNEDWMQSATWLNMLKLRASYGVNGNNGIAPYRAYGVYSSINYNGNTGMTPSTPSNEELSWEKNATWNVGVDFDFWGRLRGNVDVYERLTTDMLLSKQVPYTTGFGSNFLNAGSLKNTGVELQLDGDIISTSDFLWNVGFNISHNKTEILNLGDDEYIGSSLRHVVGKTMYTFYLKDYYGVNPSNGEALWVTEDGTLSNDYNNARYHYCGSPEPKIMGGFNTTVMWKGLSLSAFFEYKAGNMVYLNEMRYYSSDGAHISNGQSSMALNYWKKPGDVGVNPKPVAGNVSSSNAASDRWLQRGDYVRIKDVTLSYSFPKTILDKIKMKGLRVYVSGLNLYCFNDVDFWDPEMGVTGSVLGTHPMQKSVVGGVELSF